MHTGFGFFGMALMAVAAVIPLWRICTRIGFPGWISLAALIPLANLLLLYFLAFAEWPREKGGTPHRSPLPM